VEEAKENHQKCPGIWNGKVCGKNFFKRPVPNHFLTGIEDAEVCCFTCANDADDDGSEPNAKKLKLDRCPWTGTLTEAEEHFAVCDFAGISCTFDGCDVMVARRDFAAHREGCVHRLLLCKWGCGHQEKHLQRSLLDEHEEFDCANRPVECPNMAKGCCRYSLCFGVLELHLKRWCEYEEVPCPFASFGCGETMMRKDVEAHEKDAMVRHNRLMMTKVAKLETELKARNEEHKHRAEELESDVQELKEKLEVQEETIAEQEQRAEGLESDVGELKKNVKGAADLENSAAIAVLKVMVTREATVNARVDELRLALAQVSAGEVVILKIDLATLASPFCPTNINSGYTVVAGRRFRMYVTTRNSLIPGYYGVSFEMLDGPVPCKVKGTLELLHHDEDKTSEKIISFQESIYNLAISGFGYPWFVTIDEIAKANSPYVKDGTITFKCTINVVS